MSILGRINWIQELKWTSGPTIYGVEVSASDPEVQLEISHGPDTAEQTFCFEVIMREPMKKYKRLHYDFARQQVPKHLLYRECPSGDIITAKENMFIIDQKHFVKDT